MHEISSPPAATPLVIATRLSILLEYAGHNKRSSILFKESPSTDCSSVATCVDLVVGNCQLKRIPFTWLRIYVDGERSKISWIFISDIYSF